MLIRSVPQHYSLKIINDKLKQARLQFNTSRYSEIGLEKSHRYSTEMRLKICMYVVVSFSKAWNTPSKTCSIDVIANLSFLLPINVPEEHLFYTRLCSGRGIC